MRVKLFWPLSNKKRYECCISVSYFRMIKGGYKTNYIRKFLNWVNHIPDTCFVRMYVDESAFTDPEFNKVLEVKAPIEIYIYKDKRFLLEDGIHHDGTFGTMARFLPLFDDNLDVDYVWITDMDGYKDDMRKHYLTNMKKRNVEVAYNSQACYNKLWIPKDIEYPIINDKIIISKKVKLSKYKFDKFLKDVSEGKFKDLKEKIHLIRKRIASQDVKIFTYGFDEYYTNHILYKELLPYNKLVYYNLSLNTIEAQIPGIIKNIERITSLQKQLWNHFNPKTNMQLKREFEKARKDIEMNKDKLKDSPRFMKCVKDFDLYKDSIDPIEKFGPTLFIKGE